MLGPFPLCPSYDAAVQGKCPRAPREDASDLPPDTQPCQACPPHLATKFRPLTWA